MNSVNKKLTSIKIACASRGISIAQFARGIGVKQQSVDGFLHGKIKSKKINKAVNDLINSEFERLGISNDHDKKPAKS